MMDGSGVGPQYPGDDPFTRRMRLHQSRWRADVLGLPFGCGPHATSASKYGNMLTAEAGDRGLNFLTPEIGAYALRRQADFPRGIKRHRLLCNMLSSQPMCFNLFGPIALDATIAVEMASALFRRDDLRRVIRVIIEHEPDPRADYLDDATSFDAFIEVENAEGSLGFIAVETKLTEPFSPTRYPIVRGSAYQRWLDHAHAPWRSPARAAFEAIEINQLFRDHALAVAARHRTGSPYRFGALAVVRHPEDSKCSASIANYGDLVRPDGDVPLIDLPLDEATRRLRPVVAGTSWATWLDAFHGRYVDLSAAPSLIR